MTDTKPRKTLWLCLLIGSLSISPIPGQANSALTSADLMEIWVSRLSIPQTQCLASISGVTAGHALSVGAGKTFYRLPEKAGITQTKRIVVKYLRKNARSLDKDATELIFRALANAWPCPNSS